MGKKISRCPLCRRKLVKQGTKKICPACRIEVVGDTFRLQPSGLRYKTK